MTKYSFILVFLVLLSCTDENMTFDIGSKYLDVNTNIRYIDSLTVRSYTVMLDSVRTSGLSSPAILVGKYSDPEFGDVTARSYFGVSLPSTHTVPKDAVYDSMRLMLLYNDYSTGDTTVPYTIDAYRLSETLEPNDDGYFYNTSVFDTMPGLFGSVTLMTPMPNYYDTLWIDLNPAFGNELFDLLKAKDDIITYNDNFIHYFKGIMLRFRESDDAILGFQFPSLGSSSASNPVMRLYYHYTDYKIIDEYLDFPVDNSLQFNQCSLSNPLVDFPVEQKLKLPANASNNYRSYVLAGVGIATRFEIPYLKNLLELHNNIKILNAELQLEPIRNSYNVFALPEQISLFKSDNQNRFGSAILNTSTGNTQVAELQIDKVFQEETWYTFNIASYIKSEIEAETDEIPSLLLIITPDDFYGTFDRLVLGSQHNAENKVKLKVYYMYYD